MKFSSQRQSDFQPTRGLMMKNCFEPSHTSNVMCYSTTRITACHWPLASMKAVTDKNHYTEHTVVITKKRKRFHNL